MKLAYVITHPSYRPDGVTQKVRYQTEAWKKAGHEVRIFLVTDAVPEGNRPFEAELFLRRKEDGGRDRAIEKKAYAGLTDAIREFGPDAVYLRWQYHRREVTALSHEYPVFVELNGDILETARLLASQSLRRRIIYYHSLLTYRILFSQVTGFVSVTHEVAKLPYVSKFGKPIHVTPNSIMLDEFEVAPRTPAGQTPRIGFIGQIAPWHGMDKIVELARRTEGMLEIEVIGVGREEIEDCPPNLRCHGYLGRDQYLEVLHGCDVGLDGLALYRKEMKEACPLKIREYAASGLPMILSCRDTAFEGREQPDWVLQIPNREGNVEESVDRIIEFVRKMKGRRISHEESAPYFDANVVELAKLQFIEEAVSGDSNKKSAIDGLA